MVVDEKKKKRGRGMRWVFIIPSSPTGCYYHNLSSDQSLLLDFTYIICTITREYDLGQVLRG